MSDPNADTSRQVNRRSFLKTSATTLATVGGVAGLASRKGVAASSLPHSLTLIPDQTYIYYQIYVSGQIEPGSNIESGDHDHNGWAEGSIDQETGKDYWDF